MRRTVLLCLAALILAAPASAGTIVVTLGLTPGHLKVSSVRTSPTTFAVVVADGRGSGAGWMLRASRPVSVASITARCSAGSTCTLPAAPTAPAGAIVLAAAQGTGMGMVTLTVALASPAAGQLSFTAS